MNKATVVIGSFYGDEGKGLMTDYFASLFKRSLVVRFNGGAQAGHTVTTSTKRHVFGHVCSNALLGLGHDSYLSEYFVMNPLLLKKELASLNEIKVYPRIFASPECLVSTPFDMLLNQLLEKKRAKDKHGSCGVGFGETVERSQYQDFTLHAKDFLSTRALEILKKVQTTYFQERLNALGLQIYMKDYPFFTSDDFVEKFYHDAKEIIQTLTLCSLSEAYGYGQDNEKGLIFEGAQGLLLDQDLGFFPYVTRSYTGIKNVMSLLPEHIKEVDVVYASRCYTTRHGAGPLAAELANKPYENIIDNTNIPNDYQDTLRYSFLNLDIMKHTVTKDLARIDKKDKNLNIYYALTCLDQTEHVSFTYQNQFYNMKNVVFCSWLLEHLKTTLFCSWGPTRETIEKLCPNNPQSEIFFS